MADDLARAALEEERDLLVTSLRDLEQERAAGDLTDDDYRELKRRYEARAAAVLRTLDGDGDGDGDAREVAQAEPVASPGAPPPPSSSVRSVARARTRPSMRKRLVVVGLVALCSIGAGVAVATLSGEREEGQELTGTVPRRGGRIAEAQRLVSEGKVLDAIKIFDEVIEDEPRNAVALANRGWLIRIAGREGEEPALVTSGFDYVERAIAADPSYPDAHFFKAMMLWQDRDDPAGAVAEFRLFLANDPPESAVAQVEDALRRAEADAAARAAAAGSTTTTAAP